jgi:hypothetical protein
MDGAAAAPGDISPQMLAMIEAMFVRIQQGGGGGGAPNISALLAKELLDSKQPWIREAKDARDAVHEHAVAGRTVQGKKTFLVRLLQQNAFTTEVGMHELYAAFEPDQRAFWDAAVKWYSTDRAMRVHNQRVCLQAVEMEEHREHRATVERMFPAVHLMTRPLLPWAAVAMSDVAAGYQAQLMEATCQMAPLVREKMPGGLPSVLPGVTGGAGAAFAPPSAQAMLKPPPSPFKQSHDTVADRRSEVVGGEPFAPVLTAPDGTQTADLGVLNVYLTDLERRIRAGLGHSDEACRTRVEDMLKRIVAAKSCVPPVLHQAPWKKRGPHGGDTTDKKAGAGTEKVGEKGNFQ